MQCRAVSGRAGVGKGEGVQGPARRAFLPLVLGHLGVLGMWLSQAFLGPNSCPACPVRDHGSVTGLWLLPPLLTEMSFQQEKPATHSHLGT